MGRAFPEAQMTSLRSTTCRCYPITLADVRDTPSIVAMRASRDVVERTFVPHGRAYSRRLHAGSARAPRTGKGSEGGGISSIRPQGDAAGRPCRRRAPGAAETRAAVIDTEHGCGSRSRCRTFARRERRASARTARAGGAGRGRGPRSPSPYRTSSPSAGSTAPPRVTDAGPDLRDRHVWATPASAPRRCATASAVTVVALPAARSS